MQVKKIRFVADNMRDDWAQVDEAVAQEQAKHPEVIVRCTSYERDGDYLVARTYQDDRYCPHCGSEQRLPGDCPSMFHRTIG